jgi:hypothetical protein
MLIILSVGRGGRLFGVQPRAAGFEMSQIP